MRFCVVVSFIACIVFLWAQFGWGVAAGWIMIELYVEAKRAYLESQRERAAPSIPTAPRRSIRRPFGTPPA